MITEEEMLVLSAIEMGDEFEGMPSECFIAIKCETGIQADKLLVVLTSIEEKNLLMYGEYPNGMKAYHLPKSTQELMANQINQVLAEDLAKGFEFEDMLTEIMNVHHNNHKLTDKQDHALRTITCNFLSGNDSMRLECGKNKWNTMVLKSVVEKGLLEVVSFEPSKWGGWTSVVLKVVGISRSSDLTEEEVEEKELLDYIKLLGCVERRSMSDSTRKIVKRLIEKGLVNRKKTPVYRCYVAYYPITTSAS